MKQLNPDKSNLQLRESKNGLNFIHVWNDNYKSDLDGNQKRFGNPDVRIRLNRSLCRGRKNIYNSLRSVECFSSLL